MFSLYKADKSRFKTLIFTNTCTSIGRIARGVDILPSYVKDES